MSRQTKAEKADAGARRIEEARNALAGIPPDARERILSGLRAQRRHMGAAHEAERVSNRELRLASEAQEPADREIYARGLSEFKCEFWDIALETDGQTEMFGEEAES